MEETVRHRWWENIWASFIYFTRLPLWRVYSPQRESYTRVVEYWPLVGWLTGAVAGGALLLASMVFPPLLAVVIGVAMRMLLTGAFHEDGLCDFFDGFGGGGGDRQRILDIMKDSRVGTYGVLGAVVYMLLLTGALSCMPPVTAALTIAAADPFAKMVSAQAIMMLPYARKEEEAKSKVVYRKMGIASAVCLAVQGLVPLMAYILIVLKPHHIGWELPVFVPCLTMYLLYRFLLRRIGGYTGDCCGAMFLMVELSFILTVTACFFVRY